MRQILSFAVLSALFAFSANADDNPSLQKVIEKKAAEIVLQNMTVVPHAVFSDFPQSLRYTLDEWNDRLIQMIQDEKLSGDLAYRYIGLLAGESSFSKDGRKKVRQLLPDLQLSQAQLDSLTSRLSSEPKKPVILEAVSDETTGFNLGRIFADVRTTLLKLPNLFSIREDLITALDVSQKVILGKVDPNSCYQDDPGCIFSSNKGIIQFQSDALEQDHSLALDTIRYSLRLYRLNLAQPHKGNFSISDRTRLNVWKLALDSVRGDADRAMQVIAVQGHDVCCNGISSASPETKLPFRIINEMGSSQGSDSNPANILYVNGALNGVQISKKLQKKFVALAKRYKAIYGKDPYYRAGYYHVVGGMLVARELLRAGVGYKAGFKLSTVISQAMGYFYKRFSMTSFFSTDALTLWKLSGEDEKNLVDTLPEGWDELRFKKARIDLETHLLFLELTEEQHRQGADFAFRIYQRL